MNKIILVTTGQPALNPRLVKEADALSGAGYQVTVIFSYWNSWGSDFSKRLLLTKKWNTVCVGGDPVAKPVTYFMSRVIYAIAKFIINKFGPVGYFAELAASRSSFFLLREVKKHKADLYIAHYIGALAPVVKAAKKHRAKCGFDAEDFHRQEITDDSTSFNFRMTKYLEDKYLERVDYITASSQQIADAYKNLYQAKSPVTILNVFPVNNDIQRPQFITTGPVKLFWVSQTIGNNRGINVLINALQILNNAHFELHLLGDITAEDNHTFVRDMQSVTGSSIYFHEPILPDKLITFASQFDIGLALEPGFCLNNDLALSNKIFTYMQAGLAIIASDTPAQKSFIVKNPAIGSFYPKGNAQALAAILLNYYDYRDNIIACKKEALHLANQQYNWEVENLKFLSVIKKTLS